VIDPVAEQLAQSAATTREASQAVLEFRDALGEVSQSLTGAVDTIQTFQQDTLQELQNFASSLQGTLQQFQQETQGVMTQIAADVRTTIDQTLTEQTRILRETGQQAADLMDGARTNLTSTLTHIDEMLQNTRQTVQDELEVFRHEYQNALNDFFSQQNNLLSGLLDEQRQGFAEVARQLQQVFREDTQVMRENITTSMQQIRNTSEVVHNLANTLGLTAGERLAQLQELARTLGGEVQRVERSYLNMEQQVNHLLQEGSERLISYLNQANEMYSGSIREADHAASNALTQLNNTSHGLMSVAEYLVAAAQELRDGRR
jgi:phage-related protein